MRTKFKSREAATAHVAGKGWGQVGSGSQGGKDFFVFRKGDALGFLVQRPNGKWSFGS